MEFRLTFKEDKFSKSCEYFEASGETVEEKAIDVALKYIERQADNKRLTGWFDKTYKPPRTVIVDEYNNISHIAKRGGIKFKLGLSTTKFKFHGGRVETYYSYRVK